MEAKEMLLVNVSRDELHTLLVETVSRVVKRALPDSQPKEQKADPDQMLTKKEAADLLKCSTSTIDNYARAGVLIRHKIGRAVRFRRADVLAIISPSKDAA